MAQRITVALGFAEINGEAEVLYVGSSTDDAIKSIDVAGNSGKILEGALIRNPILTNRRNFEHIAAEKPAAEKPAGQSDKGTNKK